MGVHWFSGTSQLPVEVVRSELESLLGEPFVDLGHGGSGYAKSAVGAAGVRLFWQNYEGTTECLVSLSGSACEVLGETGVVAAYELAELLPKRVDLAWDIEELPVALVRDEYRAGNVVTRAHRGARPERAGKYEDNEEGATFYVGKRGSPRLVRFYDRRGPTRMELECRGVRAELVWAHLLAHESGEWSREALAVLRDFLDFRDRSSGVRPDCCPLLPWWSEVVAGAGRERMEVPREAPRTLEQKEAWALRQTACTLAVLAEVRGPRFIADLVQSGRTRWRSHHRAMVASSRLKGSVWTT